MTTSVEQYLAVGFVPDSAGAQRYLDGLFDGPDPGTSDPATLLTELLEEALGGARDVVIPLSGGNDSRGLLGAALRILPANAITCLTLSQPYFSEFARASAACRRNGVRHECLDPDHLVWDLEGMVEMTRKHGASTDRLGAVDTIFTFDRLAERIGPGVPVLSGYLGGPITGSRVRLQSRTDHADASFRHFAIFNAAATNGLRLGGLRETLVGFVAANEHRLRQFQGLTRYNLMDFGFRQPQKIRPTVTSSFSNCITPYADPRWVRFWLQRPPADRVRQRLYKQFLSAAFPTVFLEDEHATGRQPLFNRALGRGDIRVNKSMGMTLRRAAESFDRRDLLPIRFLPAMERLEKSPSDAGYVRARWLLSAEVYLRAGLL